MTVLKLSKILRWRIYLYSHVLKNIGVDYWITLDGPRRFEAHLLTGEYL